MFQVTASAPKRAAPPDDAARFEAIDAQLKRLREEKDAGSVTSALAEVRTLALRKTVDREVLIARFEHLVDMATNSQHDEADYYKLCMKAIRDAPGEIRSLVTRLIGTDKAKKVAALVDKHTKSAAKAAVQKDEPQAQAQMSPGWGPGPWGGAPCPPGPAPWSMPWGPTPWGRSGPRFGRRGGMGPRPTLKCHICGDGSHLMRSCPRLRNLKKD